MSARIRTGYSFRSAVGRIDEVITRLKEIGSTYAPITDTASTFGYVKWNKAAKKAGLKTVYGVELAVTNSINEKKPSVDYWTFIAKDSLVPINEIIGKATSQFRYQPLLTLEQALERTDVFTIVGHRADFTKIPAREGLFFGLGPALSKGQLKRAIEGGLAPITVSDNRYPSEGGQGLYETICGRGASTQSYPQWIMGDQEWMLNCKRFDLPGDEYSRTMCTALGRRDLVFTQSTATLLPAEMVHPERPKTLEAMCRDGAERLGCDLSRPEYAARLKRELDLIAEKEFEDYFYLVADICQWARERMIVGPARGSSCGSLVCYLLRITTVDPIPYGLIFERFIDINRSDLPDIDIDFPEHRRSEVFEYVAKKYGREKVARLGTVAMYQPRSALKETAGAMDIAPWLLDPVMDAIIERSSGDARALQTTEDTLRGTQAGQEFLDKYPEMLIATKMEGHPRHSGQHAAGIVITERPVKEYVAVDQRTGATQCDKKDAEELNLLKIDALGLTQLSIFERALDLAHLPRDHLFSIPLDDPAAFDVLNQKKYSGIFQFNGLSLQSISDRLSNVNCRIDCLNDIVAITALGRPGPMTAGGTDHWIQVRTGQKEETYPHPLFESHLKSSLGVVTYQEQVMTIGREIGGLSWEDVTALRKAMSKSLGKEFFDQYGDKWKNGAREKGIPEEILTKVWDDLCAYGSWCLSGDSRIANPHPNQHAPRREYTIKELYESQGLNPEGKSGQSKKRQKIMMWDGTGIRPFENCLISYSGKATTFEITTKTFKKIRATPEHEFLTKEGWVKLKDLRPGVEIAIQGERQLTDRKKKTNTGSGAHNWNNYGKEGKEFLNGDRGNRKKVLARDPVCARCNEAETQEVHHKNADHKDNRMENLIGVCRKCHKMYHREMGVVPRPFDKGYALGWDEIETIWDWGEEDVYDISMPAPHHNFVSNGIVVHNCFNLSHALAYGLVSYYCCWLKAHYPLEFAAATLSYTDSPETQIKMLREMANEGVEYLPADIDYSSDTWTVKKGGNWNHLVGPLDNVVGVGPKMMSTIMSCRARGEPLPERARKLLENPKTKIDSLFPIRDSIDRLLPDPKAANIVSTPRKIKDIQVNGSEYEVVTLCCAENIKPRNENEEALLAKRGGKRIEGASDFLNLRLADDTDVIFAKVNRWDFARLGKPIVERGKAGKALYAIKGNVPRGFRMISVKAVKYIGDME